MPGPLNDIRVLDLTQGLCGPFCTQILRDFGAEVIKIEPPSGDISRRRGTRHGSSSISYMSVNRGKKSMFLDLSQQKEKEIFLHLAETADVIVEDFGPGRSREMGIGYETVRSRKPDILYLSITGYGQNGMFKDYSDEDAIVQAISGFMSITGENGGAYTRAGIPLADVFTGIYGAIGVLAGIIFRRRTRGSLLIDLAKLNVMLSAMPDVFSKYYNTGETTRPKGCRHQLAGYFGPVEAKDGTIICMAAQDHQFKAMTEILGLEGLEKDVRFNSMHKRCVNIAELEPVIFSRSRNMTMAELTEKLLGRKIPAGPINSLEKILESDYVSYHHLIMEVTDSAEETVKVIGPPVKFGQFEMRMDDFVSQPGEHTEEIITELLTEGKKEKIQKEEYKEQKAERPLAGIRVLDLTRFMSGPLGMQILENLGAEVIKIERGDQVSEFSRSTEPTFGNTSAYFMAINSGKKDMVLNLNREEHRELFLRLAEQCDIVADNFRPGVTEKLRIAYEDVKERRPDIIYSTVSGFGYTGPYRTLGCVDTVSQAMSGFMSLTGREAGEPVRAGSSIADICASLYEAAAVLVSLIHRDKTGEGGMVDTPMLSSMLALSCAEAAEYLNHGILFRSIGNRDRERALFQTVPASDGEVMIEAASDAHFAAFARLLKLPGLLEDSRFTNAKGRKAYLKDLERAIFPVTGSMTMTELAVLCRKAGIPAGEVNTVERIARSGYIEQQHMIELVHDSREGDFKILGLPLRFDKFDIPEEKMVPQPGEHTTEVLKNMLGLSEEEIQILI
ncbi:CoA transferase [Hungatella sp.]|uniref:CaiB/BaiF CoA transferase family protein n=1 Tax=Hungatella sp. TaxID=2613924 RepID=UPI002A8155B8|nr:CoA transferase [Hungatella sp.]